MQIQSYERPPHPDGICTHCASELVVYRILLLWDVSKSCTVPKPGKQAIVVKCKRDRLIHVLDPVGKGFVAHLGRSKAVVPHHGLTNTMTHGYLKHKSREGAIRAVRLFKHRLSVARISHLLSLLGLSNAFASLDNVIACSHILLHQRIMV